MVAWVSLKNNVYAEHGAEGALGSFFFFACLGFFLISGSTFESVAEPWAEPPLGPEMAAAELSFGVFFLYILFGFGLGGLFLGMLPSSPGSNNLAPFIFRNSS